MKQKPEEKVSETETHKVLLHIVKRKGKWQGKALNFTNRKESKFKSFKEFLGWLEETKDK